MTIKVSPNGHLTLLLEARHHNPSAYLGLHHEGASHIFRTFLPHASAAWLFVDQAWVPLIKVHPDGLFTYTSKESITRPCKLRIAEGEYVYERHDPYTLPTTITEHDLYLFGEGQLIRAYDMLGAHLEQLDGVTGVRFAVWAPNAERVSVVGDFNRWDGRSHQMRVHGSSGVWELFIPDIGVDSLYKFEIRNRHTGAVMVKADPYGVSFEMRPSTAAKVATNIPYQWDDSGWMNQRAHNDWLHQPFNIYEVHLGSWLRAEGNLFINYRTLAEKLIPYLLDMAYTHIELMPIAEHPLDESWGYQTTGYFAVTSRFGTPDDFRFFVDACHQAGIGVILDWVPAHFPKDDWALARFDGTPLFEHADPRLGEHQDWGTYIFNYGRNEVRNFLLANAHFWLNEFHIDGLRVDAVASMLYLDYSRNHGEWLPNKYGGRENLEAIDFLKKLNMMVHSDFPGALTIAEESTSWPMISRPIHLGGLGFSMKWNMGWMNDTLSYMKQDPIHRRYHHNQLTFGQLYAYTENFVLPFSHDEVVHGKCSLLDKMPGDAWQKFANLRLLMTYQMAYPGKKLNFMGNEFGQGREWTESAGLEWQLLDLNWHRGIQHLMRDLGKLYRSETALYELDFEGSGFSWIDCHDADQSVISFIRRSRNNECVAVLLNFTPVPRHGYRIGVPEPGRYNELINSDAQYYGGGNMGNGAGLESEAKPWMGFPHSVVVTLPPLAGIILKRQYLG